MLLSFRPWYLLRWLENSESTLREGCTLMITSLAWYVIRATVRLYCQFIALPGKWFLFSVLRNQHIALQ